MRRAVLVTFAALAAHASAQELRLTLPRGAAPGQEVEVRCYGGGLSDLHSVLWFREGIDVLEVKAERDDRALIRLKVREDCELGSHLFLLHTRRGITRPKSFHIGPLPAVASVDGNATPERAQQIGLDVTVDGRILPEETDWFAFDAVEGQAIRIEVEGVRLADYDFDPELEVLGPDGGRIARGDDSALGRLDPIVAFRCETAGTYRVGLRDVAFRGSSYAAYRMHVGTFPRPTGVVPPGGRPGEERTVRLVGDIVAAEATVHLPERPGLHELFPVVDGRPVPTPVRVAVDDRPSFVEGEEISEPPTAPFAFHGVVGEPGEEDRFAFRAKKGERIEMRVLARNLRSPLDPVLIVRNEAGGGLAGADDGLGLDGRLRFTAPADGTFLVCVRDHLRHGGPDHFYRIEVGELPEVAKTSEAVPGRRSEDLGVVVPQGGRNATLIQVSGLDARHGIDLSWDDLPAGVVAHGGRLLQGVATVPFVFEAAPDAPIAAGLATPAARAEQEPHERAVRHEHAVPLLRVRNNQVYVARGARALPVAVAEPCPFAVDVDAPKVPIVQSGSMSLPVRISRAEGFDGTVVVKMLWTPPGISAGTATLRQGQDAGSVYVGARSNAVLGKWPLVLIAYARVDGVTRVVSTPLFELAVEEPWITARLSRARMEQGAATHMEIELKRNREFEAEVVGELGRVPKGVEAEVPAIAPDTEVLDVGLQASADAQVGRHRSVYLRLRIKTADGDIVHTVGGGEVRVDRPLPEKLRQAGDPSGVDGEEER